MPLLPSNLPRPARAIVVALFFASGISAAEPSLAETRVRLSPDMVTSESPRADFSGLADEQDIVGDPPSGKPERGWEIPAQHWKDFPYSATIDLGEERNLGSLWIRDTFGVGGLVIEAEAGAPAAWERVASHDCGRFQEWVRLPLDRTARRLRLTLESPGAGISEMALYEHTPEAHAALVRERQAAARLRAERDEALRIAREEIPRRPWEDLPPYGRLRLVDEVDCGAPDPGHELTESPKGAAEVREALGRKCRVLRKSPGEAAYLAVRLGRWKLLEPGRAYVLAIDYPEDLPRSWIVVSGGSETSRGFHTGSTVGDALHPKYVVNNNESLRVPLSGRWETWSLFFHLHDRFPSLDQPRGEGERPLTPEDGFWVAIAQLPARDIPDSAGAAVGRIRLLEVPDETSLACPIRPPPDPLPRRHIFWREEMADGVIDSEDATRRGVEDPLDWYRHKADLMRFLGVDTFSKDLLEFGACQHWDSSPGGGDEWVYHAVRHERLWEEIVELMGRRGFGVLPYYEYSGSKGRRGLGNERRAKPLTRDDGYTHIQWVETANADITDPDTLADFAKMLDITVVRLAGRARFEGVWLRPRWQLPMSFSDAARERFAREANGGEAVSRARLAADAPLLDRYREWWGGRRRRFLEGVRDHLRSNGLPGAVVLFTAEPSEPGPTFPTWEKRLVTDDPALWKEILAAPEHVLDGRPIAPLPLDRVVAEDLYLGALLSPPLTWGGWEVHHASPPPDPSRYRDAAGILLTHGFNRLYTVASPRTFDAFRGPSGLAIVRHHALNEHMVHDLEDRPKLGYFVADVERAGTFCMMAEVTAVANGDPTLIAYLSGGNFGRGFPEPVRDFDANFLALPALPSVRLEGAADDPAVVVREVRTPAHGSWLAVANTGWTARPAVGIALPRPGRVTEAVSGRALDVRDGRIAVPMGPCSLLTLRLE